ncbi:hypothetical protein H072_10490 [Dactylellina haptotyla CBS 200.50]|uniref:CBM1 domain-containing protein n=1 Tax=Dactylellina haptotyla (strain CBS 200.50) TaxID=1284197 RepID=S8BLD5_DACHA|nr:hypothetical protein H072_10490 [Dactylellina haptotyla CBS 200.50]
MAPIQNILLGVLMIPLAFAQSTTTASLPSNVQSLWGMCGGLAAYPTPFTKTLCESGATCNHGNQWLWQCIPATMTFPTSASSTPPVYPTTTTTKSSTTRSTTTTLHSISTTTTTTTIKPSTTPSATGTLVPIFGQCGGIGYKGPTACTSAVQCTVVNAYYYQCAWVTSSTTSRSGTTSAGGADCSYDLSVNKVCADSSWTLYNNTGLPFCCISGFQGAKGPWYDSCRDTAFPVSETPLPVVTQGTGQVATSAPTSVPAQTTTTAPSTSTTSSPGSQQTTTPNPPSKLSTGAIAGIVVGGILGAILIGVLAWWIGRKGGMRRNHDRGEASGFLALGVVPVGGHGSQPPPSYPVGPQELHSKPIVEIGYQESYPPRNQAGYYQAHVSELA